MKKEQIKEIIAEGNYTKIRQLFAITDDNIQHLPKKFDLWCKTFYPSVFKKKDAPFHKVMDQNLADLYLGRILTLTQYHFRGATKTTRTKLFIAFVLANDQRESRRKYLKVLSEDPINSKQFVTDVFNMLVSTKTKHFWPTLFEKTDKKREETMGSFTLASGVKLLSSTVGRNQRGHLQGEDATRPDFIIFEDFETSETVMSLAMTESIWANMEEAWNGKALEGVGLYNCNYISKKRNVQKILKRAKRSPDVHRIHKVPILDKNNQPTWPQAYTLALIEQIKKDATDFQGEYMCNPQDATDSFFSEEYLMLHPTKEPLLTKDKWTYLYKRDLSHHYVFGVDPAGGNGGDFATIVVLDNTTRMIVAFYKDRWTDPEILANIAVEKAKLYNNALLAPERNNHGHAFLLQCKHLKYTNIYEEVDESKLVEKDTQKLGILTGKTTKPAMLSALGNAVNNFALIVPSEEIREEMINFPREYVEATRIDEELGHFDLVMALAFAWQGRHQSLGKVMTTSYNKR